MHPLILKLLRKRGIENIDDLDESEMSQYKTWQEALTSSEVSVESITKFCKKQKNLIEDQYSNPDNSEKKDLALKTSLAMYKAILAFISGAKVARKHALADIEHYIKLENKHA